MGMIPVMILTVEYILSNSQCRQRVRKTHINYVPGRSSEFVKLRVRLDNSESGTLYVGKDSSSPLSPLLLHVDGIISVAELDAAEAEAKRKSQAEQEAVVAERARTLDAKAKSLASGYIYHGIDEDLRSGKLFDSGALEEGHAYYISNFVVGGSGITAGVVTTLFRDPNYQVVDYVSQKVRGDVVGASQTGLGPAPVTIVIAGGKAPLHTPVVLGLVAAMAQ
jgi:hypothetical protein